MAFGFGFGMPRSFAVPPFSPASLFASGAPGTWYDPSDINLNWRYNLLTYTEQFDNAVWSKVGATTPSANLLLLPSVNNYIFQSIPSTFAGRQFTISMELSGSGTVSIGFYDNVSSFQTDTITLTATPTTYSTTKTIGIGAVDVRAIVGRIGSATATSVSVNKASLTTAANASLPYQQIVTPEISYLNYQPQPILFQDSAGTTPVTAVEQPVGLMLDKSQGLVLGPQLRTATATVNGSWVQSGGVVTASGSSGFDNTSFTLSTPTIAGRFYEISMPNTMPAGSFYVDFGTGTGSQVGSLGGPTQQRLILTCTAAGSVVRVGRWTGAPSGTIGPISVREIPGNHAFQSTAASRPVLSARYNLLTATEDFSSASWTKTGTTATAGRLVASAGAGNHYLRQTIPSTVTIATALTIEVKRDNYDWLFIGPSDSLLTYFNTATGAFGNLGAGVTSTSSVLTSDGYWQLTINTASAALSNYCAVGLAGGNGVTGFTATGTEAVLVRKASLVPANQSTLPYQRVNTSTDYDTVGFKPYLKFDGVDDSMSTNSINFTSTDKMSVFAGVRKLSDAAYQAITELSANPDSTANTFTLGASTATGDASRRTWGFGSRGNAAMVLAGGAVYVAPITNVITGLGDISGDQAILRVNGVQAAISTADQGTGNYSNNPLYLGRRGGSSLPFNGQLYSMIIVGKAVTAGELSSSEAYVNQKTGAY